MKNPSIVTPVETFASGARVLLALRHEHTALNKKICTYMAHLKALLEKCNSFEAVELVLKNSKCAYKLNRDCTVSQNGQERISRYLCVCLGVRFNIEIRRRGKYYQPGENSISPSAIDFDFEVESFEVFSVNTDPTNYHNTYHIDFNRE